MKSLNNPDKRDVFISYVPHGINSNVYCKMDVPDTFRKSILGDTKWKFVLFWMNRNIRRKQPSDVIWAFKQFVDRLPEADRSLVCLVMHTQPADQNGTDLKAVAEKLAPDCNIIFSEKRLQTIELAYLYNLADVTINIAGNEGFGLGTAESVMTETPIIVSVTGGLQDQCGFKKLVGNEWVEFTHDDYIKIGSLHDKNEWKARVQWGEWVTPIWAASQTLIGSVPTPYIIDDKVDVVEVADAIHYWYEAGDQKRKQAGKLGREWMLGSGKLNHTDMSKLMIQSIETTIDNFKPKKTWNIYQIH
jgi:glycosyltransferase involved in cell wall biosynthesis